MKSLLLGIAGTVAGTLAYILVGIALASVG